MLLSYSHRQSQHEPPVQLQGHVSAIVELHDKYCIRTVGENYCILRDNYKAKQHNVYTD